MRKITTMIFMMIAATAAAQQIDLKSLDKLADKAKSKTEINMDESMLKSAVGFLNQSVGDEALAKKSTEGLKGFYMRAYEFDTQGAYTPEDLKPLLDQLKPPDWVVLLRNTEGDEDTQIWMHRTNEQADGLVLISGEANELVVMNALGTARLEDLARLGGQLGDIQNSSPPAPPAGK